MMMEQTQPRFLVDVNLPARFSLWNTPEYIHQRDIDDTWQDEQIWEYARVHTLTIITKDADFSHRIVLHTPPPRVIHIRIGNMSLRELFTTMTLWWETARQLSATHKLVTIFADHVEAVE